MILLTIFNIYIYIITLKDDEPILAANEANMSPSPTPAETPKEPAALNENSDPSLASEALARKDTTQLEVTNGLGQVKIQYIYISIYIRIYL